MAKNTSVLLGDHFEEFIRSRVESGKYQNASDVIRAALRRLEDDEAKEAAVLKALDAGLASGRAEPGTFARVRAKYGGTGA